MKKEKKGSIGVFIYSNDFVGEGRTVNICMPLIKGTGNSKKQYLHGLVSPFKPSHSPYRILYAALLPSI